MYSNRDFVNYEDYFKSQAGGNLDISYYKGSPYQRGHGFFSTFAKRYGIPVLKYLARQGLHAGKDILADVASGKKFSTSAKASLKKRAASTLKDFGEKFAQGGSGLRKRPRLTKKRRKRKSKSSKRRKSKGRRRKTNIKRKSKKSKKSKKFDIFS